MQPVRADGAKASAVYRSPIENSMDSSSSTKRTPPRRWPSMRISFACEPGFYREHDDYVYKTARSAKQSVPSEPIARPERRCRSRATTRLIVRSVRLPDLGLQDMDQPNDLTAARTAPNARSAITAR